MALAVSATWWACVSAVADGLQDLGRFTSRFYAIHTNLSKKEAVGYGAHMDLVFASYSKQFRALRGKKQDPQDLYLLRTHADYIETLRDLGIDGTGSGGIFFWGNTRSGLVTWVEGKPRGRTLAVLQHEGFHQFARARLGDELPIWVNEGLAEYYEHAIVVAGKLRTGIVDGDRLASVHAAVKTNKAIPFDTLLNTTHAEWNRFVSSGVPRGKLQYAQSWLIVHFLVHGDGGRYTKAFTNYLVALSGGRDHTVAFRSAFGTLDTELFARRWLKFLDDAEPDNFSEAVNRVQFLAAGMVNTRGDAGWPATLEELKTRMTDQGFALEYVSDAGRQSLTADDAKWYVYIDDEGVEQPFEFRETREPKRRRGSRRVAASEDAEPLPPTLVAAGLIPSVHLTWKRDEAGLLQPQVEYPSLPAASEITGPSPRRLPRR